MFSPRQKRDCRRPDRQGIGVPYCGYNFLHYHVKSGGTIPCWHTCGVVPQSGSTSGYKRLNGALAGLGSIRNKLMGVLPGTRAPRGTRATAQGYPTIPAIRPLYEAQSRKSPPVTLIPRLSYIALLEDIVPELEEGIEGTSSLPP